MYIPESYCFLNIDPVTQSVDEKNYWQLSARWNTNHRKYLVFLITTLVLFEVNTSITCSGFSYFLPFEVLSKTIVYIEM